MKSIVVAYDENRGIGLSGDLLWKRDLPADLGHFKETTMGSCMIMGRKTFESIGRPLPGRRTIVVSRSMEPSEGITVARSLEGAYTAADCDNIFVIGGGQIYTLALDSVDQVIATEVDASFAADTYFPKLDMAVWSEASRQHYKRDDANKYNYDFVTYSRL